MSKSKRVRILDCRFISSTSVRVITYPSFTEVFNWDSRIVAFPAQFYTLVKQVLTTRKWFLFCMLILTNMLPVPLRFRSVYALFFKYGLLLLTRPLITIASQYILKASVATCTVSTTTTTRFIVSRLFAASNKNTEFFI